MIKKYIVVSIIVSVTVGLLCSCGRRPGASSGPPTSTELSRNNATRKSIGIRTIKPTWHFSGRNRVGEEDWKLIKGDYQAKRVHKEADGIVWEEDYYYSGRTFTTIDGTIWEHLTLHYDYASSTFAIRPVTDNPTIEALAVPFFMMGTTNISEAAAVADKILTLWGKTRL